MGTLKLKIKLRVCFHMCVFMCAHVYILLRSPVNFRRSLKVTIIAKICKKECFSPNSDSSE